MIYRIVAATAVSLALGTAALAQSSTTTDTSASGMPTWDDTIKNAFLSDPAAGTVKSEEEIKTSWATLSPEPQAQVKAKRQRHHGYGYRYRCSDWHRYDCQLRYGYRHHRLQHERHYRVRYDGEHEDFDVPDRAPAVIVEHAATIVGGIALVSARAPN